MFTVKKVFEFCYAHKLYKYPGKCGNIHGHTVKAEISCKVKDLDDKGMGVDFVEMKKKIGEWIEKTIDHRLVLDKKDPVAQTLKDAGEDVLEIDTPPSAENFAKMIFYAVREMGFPVSKVSLWESPTSEAKFKE